jgi:DeoR/GlpR family transcriptional regulator of sugar metabolism
MRKTGKETSRSGNSRKDDQAAQAVSSLRLEQGITQRGLYILTKMIQQGASKVAIAKHVAKQYVEDFDAVLLDAGSTAELIAEELFIQRKYLSVMTNNMGAYAAYTRAITSPQNKRAASLHQGVPRAGLLHENELLLPGGRYDATYEASFGDRTIEAIQTFTPNVTIIGVSGLLFEKGVFCHGAEEVRVKHLLWTIPTDTRLIAADWSKIGKRDAHAFGHTIKELKLGARKAVVVTNKPSKNAPSDERKEFDQQVRLMQEADIIVDVLDVPEHPDDSGDI